MQCVKIATTVPETHADVVRKAAGDVIGVDKNYSHATFSVKGVGRFIPHDGAHPAIGEIGKLEEVAEEQIWFTCPREKAKAVVEIIRRVHPYEEAAIDVYRLENG
jgi:hypothetical protein